MSCSMTCNHALRFLFIGDHFGHDRLLGNLGHLFGFLVEEIGASQQGQHQQHHNGGQHSDDGVQFLALGLQLGGGLGVAGVVVSAAVHSLAGHHGVAILADGVDGANGSSIIGIRIPALVGGQLGAVRGGVRRGGDTASAAGRAVGVRGSTVIIGVISRVIGGIVIGISVIRVTRGVIIGILIVGIIGITGHGNGIT